MFQVRFYRPIMVQLTVMIHILKNIAVMMMMVSAQQRINFNFKVMYYEKAVQ